MILVLAVLGGLVLFVWQQNASAAAAPAPSPSQPIAPPEPASRPPGNGPGGKRCDYWTTENVFEGTLGQPPHYVVCCDAAHAKSGSKVGAAVGGLGKPLNAIPGGQIISAAFSIFATGIGSFWDGPNQSECVDP